MASKQSTNGQKSLVIVESPAKAKTINRYLGAGYEVMASMGHVRDLPPNEFGVDLERNFEPTYQVLADKKKIVNGLKKAARRARDVFLATDLDREGEAIAWHLVHALDLDQERTSRVVFNEITKSAIQSAFSHPHHLDMDKVNAQQARRLLDRIVGYQLSPLLQAKIAKGLSAGRVQSVAVRLIVEREKEIRAFVPQESWQVLAVFGADPSQADRLAEAWIKFAGEDHAEGGESRKGGPTQKARNAWLAKHGCLAAELVRFGSEDFKASSVDAARRVVEAMGFVVDRVDEREWEQYAGKDLKIISVEGRLDPSRAPEFSVRDVQKRRTSTKPSPPFTTAALQQAASSEYGFSPSRTMRIAQQLYEGVDLGGKDGQVGLITYMRTDSTNLSADSVAAVRTLIGGDYGDRYLPDKPNVYGSNKRAQEAHEAIRPSDVRIHPDHIRDHVSRDQYKLYDLIWRRFVACQMTPAQWDGTTVLIGTDLPEGEAVFRATGRVLAFDGFYKVMGVPTGDTAVLPELQQGQQVAAIDLYPRQQFTSPPPRYSEAALVKKLEAEGIGRPSTYAAIIQTIQDRNYVDLIDKRLHPTQRGEIVTDRLIEHFPQIMDLKFTSYMEEELDKIEEAHHDWVLVLNEFYEPFKAALEKAKAEMQRARAEPSEYTCPECGRQLVYRIGKNGRFLACSGYPDCKQSMNVDADGRPVPETVAEEPCPECGREMVLRKSRLGPFLGCSGYPDCSVTIPADEQGRPLRKVKPEEIKEECPECGSAMAVKFARGRAFLGCSSYPKCKATKPIPQGLFVEKPKPAEAGARCDKCGRAMVIRTGRRGPFLSCSGFPKCRNAMPMEKLDELRAKEEAGEIPEAPPEPTGNNGRSGTVPRKKDGKVDLEALGNPPPGFAWTRTGKPVVETMPEGSLTCPDCGGEATMKSGRFGPYFSCTNYPKCKFTANLRGEAKKQAEAEMPAPAKPKPVPTDVPCSECGSNMVIRTGRTGPFLGCSKYPKCRNSQPLPPGESVESLAVAESG